MQVAHHGLKLRKRADADSTAGGANGQDNLVVKMLLAQVVKGILEDTAYAAVILRRNENDAVSFD